MVGFWGVCSCGRGGLLVGGRRFGGGCLSCFFFGVFRVGGGVGWWCLGGLFLGGVRPFLSVLHLVKDSVMVGEDACDLGPLFLSASVVSFCFFFLTSSVRVEDLSFLSLPLCGAERFFFLVYSYSTVHDRSIFSVSLTHPLPSPPTPRKSKNPYFFFPPPFA